MLRLSSGALIHAEALFRLPAFDHTCAIDEIIGHIILGLEQYFTSVADVAIFAMMGGDHCHCINKLADITVLPKRHNGHTLGVDDAIISVFLYSGGTVIETAEQTVQAI